jgi:hypothetical protein
VVEYRWDVHVPGEDLPHRVITDYLVSEGEEIEVGGLEWVIDSVEMTEVDAVTGVVTVVPRHA